MSVTVFCTEIFVAAIFHVCMGMLAYYLMVEGVKFRDTEGCAMLSIIWPLTLGFWLIFGWPAMAIMWIYNRITRAFVVKTYREVK